MCLSGIRSRSCRLTTVEMVVTNVAIESTAIRCVIRQVLEARDYLLDDVSSSTNSTNRRLTCVATPRSRTAVPNSPAQEFQLRPTKRTIKLCQLVVQPKRIPAVHPRPSQRTHSALSAQ